MESLREKHRFLSQGKGATTRESFLLSAKRFIENTGKSLSLLRKQSVVDDELATKLLNQIKEAKSLLPGGDLPGKLKERKRKRLPCTDAATGHDDKDPFCTFFLKKKQKRCCFQRVRDSLFCSVHNSIGEDRVPCPINPQHTVCKSNLNRHIKVCPDRKSELLLAPYFSRNINAFAFQHANTAAATTKSESRRLSATAIERVTSLVSNMMDSPTVKRFLPLKAQSLRPKECDIFFQQKSNHKMPKQNASISGHILHAFKDYRPEKLSFVEVGAGKGFLSLAVCKTTKGKHFVLVDNRHFRNKADARLREEGAFIERQYLDLKDWAFEGTLSIFGKETIGKYSGNKAVVVGKHVCGVATCYALRCCGRVATKQKLAGVCVATCCHHKLVWDNYVNQKFFTEHGFNAKDFEVLSRLSSWAVSDFLHRNRKAKETQGTHHEENNDEHGKAVDEPTAIDLHPDEKRKIGHACKNLADIGRALYLEELGYKVEILNYVDSDTSLENRLLIAVDPLVST